MPPDPRFVPRFAAEPPQEALPYGRWAERLQREFLAACLGLEDEEEIGAPGDIAWYPDRTWQGRTYVPATALTSKGYELFGYVSFASGEEEEREDMVATADYTEETAERNPDWKLDICDEVIGSWRGEGGASAKMTLVWGRALVHGGRVATAELGETTVDQCVLMEERFTLVAPDDLRDELLEMRLFDAKGGVIASESLYAPDDEEGAEDEEGGA